MANRQGYQSRSRSFAYFEAVASHGSMRKAAATLNVASSALNRKILDLETDLGVLLFERLPRGVRLTSSGELLLGHVRRTSRDLEITCGQIEDLRGLRRGHVRLAVIEAMTGVVTKLMLASLKSHPQITFDYRVMGTQEVLSSVAREEVDIGYAFNPPEGDRVFFPVAECLKRLHAFVARDHPLAGSQALRLSECVAYPVLYGNMSLGGRHLLDAAAENASLSLRPMVTANSIGILKTIASGGQGVCFQLNIDPESEHDLLPIPLRDQNLRGRLVIGVKKNRQLPSAAAVFLERLKADLVERGDN
nr:LysR family transcriptional regulator [uncultured Lichenicoccus sp.]